MYSTGILGCIDSVDEPPRGVTILSEPYDFAVHCRGGRSMLTLAPSELPQLDVSFSSREMRGQTLFALLHVWRYFGDEDSNAPWRAGHLQRYSSADAGSHRARHVFPLVHDPDADVFVARFGERAHSFEVAEQGLFVGTFFLVQEHLARVRGKRAFKDVVDAGGAPVVSDLFFFWSASPAARAEHGAFSPHQ